MGAADPPHSTLPSVRRRRPAHGASGHERDDELAEARQLAAREDGASSQLAQRDPGGMPSADGSPAARREILGLKVGKRQSTPPASTKPRGGSAFDVFQFHVWSDEWIGRGDWLETVSDLKPGQDPQLRRLHLRRRFGQGKIFLVGHSWGTFLGIWMAQQRPGWYRAYVGVSQMVDAVENDRLFYQLTLDRARREGDRRTEKALLKAGPPLYTTARYTSPGRSPKSTSPTGGTWAPTSAAAAIPMIASTIAQRRPLLMHGH